MQYICFSDFFLIYFCTALSKFTSFFAISQQIAMHESQCNIVQLELKRVIYKSESIPFLINEMLIFTPRNISFGAGMSNCLTTKGQIKRRKSQTT